MALFRILTTSSTRPSSAGLWMYDGRRSLSQSLGQQGSAANSDDLQIPVIEKSGRTNFSNHLFLFLNSPCRSPGHTYTFILTALVSFTCSSHTRAKYVPDASMFYYLWSNHLGVISAAQSLRKRGFLSGLLMSWGIIETNEHK